MQASSNYEPAELILTARPGTPLAAIRAALQAKRQMLAFEPPEWRALFGSNAEPTLGGVLACNLAGPRRVRSGAARDFFLGFSAVNGVGEIWKAGGKVVKNVTGYDMSKLLAGSFGTLSVLTEVTLKVSPRPETERTILLAGLADEVAVATMAKALNTPFEVSSVAHLPPAAARRSGVAEVADGLGAITAVRLEGPGPSVAYRVEAIEALLGHGARLDDDASGAFWQEVGEVQRLLPPLRAVWRLCPPPSAAPAIAADIRTRLPSAEVFFDWGGGLVWLSLDAEDAGPDAGAGIVRAAVKPHGGHATLIVAPEAIRPRRRVRAGAGPARRAHGPHQGPVRSHGRAQSGPDAGGAVAAMQTNFSAAQLGDPAVNASEKILRACVHCGFCTATCPTYALLGDELDSPRGRIYLIKDMLEADRPATPEVVKHIDRCLSCLSCMTTCPSGVNYMHLVDHARHHIEKTYRRPWLDRIVRRVLGFVLPRPKVFSFAMTAASLAKPFAGLLPQALRAPLDLVPKGFPAASPFDRPRVVPSASAKRRRVALMTGCAQNSWPPRSTRRPSGFSPATAARS